VLLQLRHDPRTVVLLLAVPPGLLAMMRYVLDSSAVFDRVAPALLGFFPFLLMFLVTVISTLRERSSGTLERLLTTPMGRLELLIGYATAFAVVAAVQAGLTVAVSIALGLHLAGGVAPLLLVAMLDALLGVALGLFASAFARTEFQAVQFMPLVVLPQLLVSGVLAPRGQMATALQWLADVLPLSYAVEALQEVATSAGLGRVYLRGVLVVSGSIVLAVVLAAATVPRRSR
jgi:ABC-2 type transport system permease protein